MTAADCGEANMTPRDTAVMVGLSVPLMFPTQATCEGAMRLRVEGDRGGVEVARGMGVEGGVAAIDANVVVKLDEEEEGKWLSDP